MQYFNAFVVFVLTWWVVIFAVLPWGNQPDDTIQPGYATSAPSNPRIKQKMIWTTIISAVITAAIMAFITYSGFSFRNDIMGMP